MTFARKLAAAAMTTVASAGLVVAIQAPASAYPMSCAIYAHPTGSVDGRMARCKKGTGQYRIKLRCNPGRIYNLPDYYEYGPWRSPSATSFSAFSCFGGKTSGFYRASSISIRA